MSSIIAKKIGNQVYLYESESYRNEEGKPRNNRKLVGKIDFATGNPIFKPEFAKRIKEAGETIKLPSLVSTDLSKPVFSVNAVRNSTVKEFGAFYLFEHIANESGLLEILQETFPYRWEQILNLACYIVASGEPLMYCEDWLLKTESIRCQSMSPQRIADLFQSISVEERTAFFEKWGLFRCEREYLALDITSVSSYSELIADVEWGYNRDKEKLPQINLCMLMGEKSGLPVFQSPYSGSLRDVSTLKTTFQLASNIPLSNATIVMDKGFCSVKNINTMLSDKQGFKFLIAMSFTLKFTKEQVLSEKNDIDRLENTIVIGDDVMRCVTNVKPWNVKHKVFVHTYFNAAHAAQIKEKLYGRIAKLVEHAKLDPNNPKLKSDYKKYLIIQKFEDICGYSIAIQHKAIEDELLHNGWLILISNHIDNAKDAIYIYRAKDVVEKGFLRMKNCLDLGRLRVHSDNSMQNKVFIGFIALILMSFIHNVMSSKDIYRYMTMKSLIKTLEKLRVQYINGSRILFPLTKQQKDIYDAFDLDYPS